MRSTDAKPLKLRLFLLLAMTAGTVVFAQTSPYSTLPKIPSPFLKAPKYKGPPLSTALPSSGAFKRGLSMGTTSGTARRSTGVPNRAAYHPIAPIRPYSKATQQSYLRTPSITGRSMSAYAMSRGITTGLSF